jgi:hypothetical protein
MEYDVGIFPHKPDNLVLRHSNPNFPESIQPTLLHLLPMRPNGGGDSHQPENGEDLEPAFHGSGTRGKRCKPTPKFNLFQTRPGLDDPGFIVKHDEELRFPWRQAEGGWVPRRPFGRLALAIEFYFRLFPHEPDDLFLRHSNANFLESGDPTRLRLLLMEPEACRGNHQPENGEDL